MTDFIEVGFNKFHTKNPWVYDRLRTMSLQLKQSGCNSYGIAALFEVLRYEYAMKTQSDDGFKLNNNYAALYARKLVQNEPELKEFFRMRARRSQVDAWDKEKNSGTS